MGNQFSTMSTEMVEREIRKFEEKMKGRPSEQDKLMLFALKSEFDQRQKETKTSESTKLRTTVKEIMDAQEKFAAIDIKKISSEELLDLLLKFYHSQVEFTQKINKIIDERSKSD